MTLGKLGAWFRRQSSDPEGRLEKLLSPFHGREPLDSGAYEQLFQYFVEGWARYRSPAGARVMYPGWPSWSGRRSDEMEGFARLMPLFGAWICGGRSQVVKLENGSSVDLVDAFRSGLLAGTNPSSPEYWGTMDDRDQRIVEAADIALALWLFRNSAWNALGTAGRSQVVRWLAQANAREVYDSNWHLFIVTVNTVLTRLGFPLEDDSTPWRYRRIKEFYLGDGWFSDGADGKVDYYNAWAFHYSLYWLEQVCPSFDPDFIGEARTRFLESYRYLIGPRGFPVLGRSVCYRLAVSAPLVFGHRSCPSVVTAGEARRALDESWRYFIRRDALHGGNVTQGYFGPDPRILDIYSGPASCLWSLRSLVVAFYHPWSAEFWRTSGEPLPVEKESYRVHVPATGWTIRGDAASRVISVKPGGGSKAHAIRLRPHGIFRRLLELLYRTPQRPDNYEAKYEQRRYWSEPPFFATSKRPCRGRVCTRLRIGRPSGPR